MLHLLPATLSFLLSAFRFIHLDFSSTGYKKSKIQNFRFRILLKNIRSILYRIYKPSFFSLFQCTESSDMQMQNFGLRFCFKTFRWYYTEFRNRVFPSLSALNHSTRVACAQIFRSETTNKPLVCVRTAVTVMYIWATLDKKKKKSPVTDPACDFIVTLMGHFTIKEKKKKKK